VNEDLKKWLPWILVGVLALALTGFIIAGLGGGDTVAGDTTTTVPSTTSTVADTTTTLPETTTSGVPETTTTTVPETTTTAPPETTTTTLAPVTTTTTAAAVVELSDEGIQAGDTWVYFGYDDEATIAAVSAVLGSPTIDSGWVEEPLCPPPAVRTVRWNDLWLLFTQADTDFWSGGVPHFFTFYYSGATPEIYTTEGIGLGSSLEMLEAAYGGPSYTIGESPFAVGEGFWTYDLQTWTGMWGFATGQTAVDTVTAINGGQGCGE